MQNHTCLQRRAGVRTRGGNQLVNQVLNRVILRGSTPLCLAERLAENCSLFNEFSYIFDFVVPPHGHWLLSTASVNTATSTITAA